MWTGCAGRTGRLASELAMERNGTKKRIRLIAPAIGFYAGAKGESVRLAGLIGLCTAKSHQFNFSAGFLDFRWMNSNENGFGS